MKNKKCILAIWTTILLIIFLGKGITVHAQQIEPKGWVVYNKNIKECGDSSYYSTLTINGETVIIDRLRKIALSDKITQLNRGTKKQISLLATYEEVIFDEELIYTENLLKGVIDPRSLNTELITFKSEHPEIIEVTDSGELIAISKGTSRITVKIGTNKKLKLQFVIRVK